MTITFTNTFVAHTKAKAADVNQNFTDAKTVIDALADSTTAQTLSGAKTFTNAVKLSAHLELANITDPTAVTNKGQLYAKADNTLYFQDAAGNKTCLVDTGAVPTVTTTTGADTSFAQSETLTITHDSDPTYKRRVAFRVYNTDHWEPIYHGATYTIQMTDTTTVLTKLSAGTSSVKGAVTIFA